MIKVQSIHIPANKKAGHLIAGGPLFLRRKSVRA